METTGVYRWLKKEFQISGSQFLEVLQTCPDHLVCWKLEELFAYREKVQHVLTFFFPLWEEGGVNSEILEKDSTPQVKFPTHPPVFPSKNSQVNEWNFREIKDQKLRTSMTPTTPWVLARMAVVQLVALAQQRWWKSNVPALTGIWGWKLEGQGWGVTGWGWWMLIMNYDDDDYGCWLC